MKFLSIESIRREPLPECADVAMLQSIRELRDELGRRNVTKTLPYLDFDTTPSWVETLHGEVKYYWDQEIQFRAIRWFNPGPIYPIYPQGEWLCRVDVRIE